MDIKNIGGFRGIPTALSYLFFSKILILIYITKLRTTINVNIFAFQFTICKSIKILCNGNY